MRAEGLEPPRLAPPAPKAGVSTNSTTPADDDRRNLPEPGKESRNGPSGLYVLRRMAPRDMVIEHPNRDKPESKATKGIVVVLLIISVALLVIITLGGGDKLEGAWPIQVAYILLYALMAFRITQWRSGLLPVVAALAIILAIFAAVAGPDWLARDKDGYESPPMDSDLLGILTFVVVPV